MTRPEVCRENVRQLAGGTPVDEECGEPLADGESVCRFHARLAIAARSDRA